MRNVAIIIQNLNGGGAERTASNLSLYLSAKYNMHLIVFDSRNITYPYKGKLHDLETAPVAGKLGKTVNVLKRVRAVKKILRKEKIDCAISLMDGANLVNVLSKQKNKVITSVRNQMSKTNQGEVIVPPRLKKMTEFISKKSDYMVSLSKGVEEDLRVNFGVAQEKLVTIYNPCEYEQLLKNTEKTTLELPAGNALITMGRLNPQKGQWHLIRALTLVKQQIPDVKLYILGQGELQEKLQKLIDDLELSENVKLLGYVEAPHSSFQYADCFVFPSMFEGLGNALLEAMAFGLPCISTDCYSGPREILAPGTKMQEHLEEVAYCEYGVLTSVCSGGSFNAEDPLSKEEKQLAEAIVTMLTDNALRQKYAQKSRERVLDFAPEKIAADWMKVIEE